MIRINVNRRGGERLKATMEQVKKALQQAGGYEVAVGYPVGVDNLGQPDPNYDSGASVIEVALANNYGIGVPQRPFMDLAAKDMKKTYTRVMEKLGPKIIDGTAKVEKVLEVAGMEAEEDVRKAIMDGPWEPNSEATIKAKGSDRPLVDTHTLHNKVTSKVRRRA